MKVVLELQDQPSNVRRVTVRHDIVIGRGADCNLRLSAPQISRRHCFLRVGRDGVSVTDLDSSNGTFVDGERLKSGVRQPLQNGSQLSLGPIRFLIQVRDDAVSSESKNASASKEKKAVEKGKSEPSTIVADVDATMRSAQAMNLAVEQAGATADSREVTSDFVAGQSGASPADAAKKRAAQLPKVDSRAEIVDLGRQLVAAEEDAKNQTFSAPSKPATPQKSASASPDAPLAKVVPRDISPPLPPVEDVDAAPDDMSFFEDFAAEKTVTPLDDKDVGVEEIFDVAEVVEELPDDNIEVVEDDEEIFEVAEVVEEIEEAIEVVDEDDSSSVRGSSAGGNVMSLDDDWEDPDAPARRHRPAASSSSAPQKLSQAARGAGSGPASSPWPAASAPKPTGSAKPVSAALKNAAPVAAAALPLAVPELVEEAEIVEVVEEVDNILEVVEVGEFAELVEPIEEAVVAVDEEVVEVFDEEVAAVGEADVVEVIEEVEPVEDVLEVTEFEPIVEPMASLETVPVDEVEAAEILEVSDFFDAAEPEAEVAEIWGEPEVVAADVMMEMPPARELQNEPWSEMAQEELAIEDAPIDADEFVPVAAVSERTKASEFANFAEVAEDVEVLASEVSDEPVFAVEPFEADEADVISSAEPEFNPDWLSADDEPLAEASSPLADEIVSNENVADWLTAEAEVESVEVVDVIDAAEVSQPELLAENNDVEVISEEEIVAVEELLVEDEADVPQSTEARGLNDAEGVVESVAASVNDGVDAGDDVMSWLSGDSEELVDPADFGVSSEPDANGDLSTKDDDDIDPNLRDFLKGF